MPRGCCLLPSCQHGEKPQFHKPNTCALSRVSAPSCGRQRPRQLERLGCTISPTVLHRIAEIPCSQSQEPLARNEAKSSFKIFQPWNWKNLIRSKRGSYSQLPVRAGTFISREKHLNCLN